MCGPGGVCAGTAAAGISMPPQLYGNPFRGPPAQTGAVVSGTGATVTEGTFSACRFTLSPGVELAAQRRALRPCRARRSPGALLLLASYAEYHPRRHGARGLLSLRTLL